MTKELVIGSNRHETKVAILEDDQLVEVYFQRANEYSLAGSIHKGRVTRVLPGMQSAFVDLGLERDTFLYVSDFFEENEDIDTVAEEKPARPERRERNAPRVSERQTFQAPVVQPVIVAPPELTEPAAATAEGESGFATANIEAGTAAPESAERSGDRPQDAFRGDRRGRRSRRRRQRGRGFPENKYAQASGASVSEPERQEPIEEQVEAAEVILLPGESLAKYRNVTERPPAREQS